MKNYECLAQFVTNMTLSKGVMKTGELVDGRMDDGRALKHEDAERMICEEPDVKAQHNNSHHLEQEQCSQREGRAPELTPSKTVDTDRPGNPETKTDAVSRIHEPMEYSLA